MPVTPPRGWDSDTYPLLDSDCAMGVFNLHHLLVFGEAFSAAYLCQLPEHTQLMVGNSITGHSPSKGNPTGLVQ